MILLNTACVTLTNSFERRRFLFSDTLVFYHRIEKSESLIRIGPKQLSALAHLGCSREAGTS